MQRNQVILGIDPGTIVTGYGVIQIENGILKPLDFGTICPPKKLEIAKRYLIIYEGIEALIKSFSPNALAVETQFVYKNVQSAIKLGMARGIVLLAGAKNHLPIFEYAPKKAKIAVTGNGSASKEQVQKMIKLLLSLSQIPEPEDAADGLALAICHANQLCLNI